MEENTLKKINNTSKAQKGPIAKVKKVRINVTGPIDYLIKFNNSIIDWLASDITKSILLGNNWKKFNNEIISVEQYPFLFADDKRDIYERMLESVHKYILSNIEGSLVINLNDDDYILAGGDISFLSMFEYFNPNISFPEHKYSKLRDIKVKFFKTNLPYDSDEDKLSIICDSFVRSITSINKRDNIFDNLKEIGIITLDVECPENEVYQNINIKDMITGIIVNDYFSDLALDSNLISHLIIDVAEIEDN